MIKLIALKRLISLFKPLSLPTANQLTNKKFVDTYAILLHKIWILCTLCGRVLVVLSGW